MASSKGPGKKQNNDQARDRFDVRDTVVKQKTTVAYQGHTISLKDSDGADMEAKECGMVARINFKSRNDA